MRRSRQERIEAFKEMTHLNIGGKILTYGVNDRVKNFDAFSQLIDDLGYFDAPASANHHGTNKGDLFEHSYMVAKILMDYTEKLGLTWNNPTSPIIIGLFHDLCKMDQYIYVGNDVGKWKYRDDQMLKGHGDKSVMILSTYMTLTEEEMLCIRYHMGAYNTDDWKQYDLAIRAYPNVLYTHTADMMASKVYNI